MNWTGASYNETMILETFPVGPLQSNCTILGDEESGEAIVIDPGDEVGRIYCRLAGLGLNSGSYNHLITLYAAGPDYTLTQNEIRLYVHTTHASVAQMVQRLERDGLVKRTKNPRDARSVIVKLTPKGVKLMQVAAPMHHLMIEEKLRHVSTADRRHLMDLLLAINRGFDEENETDATDASLERARKVAVRAAQQAS